MASVEQRQPAKHSHQPADFYHDAHRSDHVDSVGYSSPYALSSAFKRVRGVSPMEHRTKALAGAASGG